MFNKLKQAFSYVKIEYKENSFNPILEDDVIARIYYHLLNNNEELKAKIFIKTRVLLNIPHLNTRNKYDLVIGKRISELNKVYVEPELVSEFKIFPIGFSPQQRSKRRYHPNQDITKLSEIEIHYRKIDLSFCFFDAIGWLNGFNQGDSLTRLEKLINFRNSINSSIRIIGILAKDKNDKNPELIIK